MNAETQRAQSKSREIEEERDELPACGEKEPVSFLVNHTEGADPRGMKLPPPASGERVPPKAAGEGRHLTERVVSGGTAQRALSAPPLIRVLRTHLLPACGEKEPGGPTLRG